MSQFAASHCKSFSPWNFKSFENIDASKEMVGSKGNLKVETREKEKHRLKKYLSTFCHKMAKGKQKEMVMNSGIIYDERCCSRANQGNVKYVRWQKKISQRSKRRRRRGKFEFQIIEKWLRNIYQRKLANRLESNSIKEINLIGFWTLHSSPSNAALSTLLSGGKNWS